ncbi:Dihydroorotate dehydrogenase B (NAD(+)), catalytic subunit [Pseudodesulfovibrio profundus]|uniref:Dihydroorotate dehydrogenase n=1 Tax=Pseudodesulfovibrio profundus TaxID=57320 RepID=A0A2C8F8F4_9BACT|nr:dihydroorotate dehydrogenase [Pseudodesulfovibrio profundus]SOB58125.1 Dihydroorotate dehydrogenase B (NAD(+)), catalytic subunit [Pseudodesulfovibrio profundus]
MDMNVSFGGLDIKNPIMTASGTFGFGLEFAAYGDLSKLGAIVAKGLSLKPREGNPMPRIAETPCGMLNAIGIQNPGVENFITQALPALKRMDVAVIANLYACDAEEFGELAAVLAAEDGVAALEVNVSCPNVKEGGIAFGQDPAQIGKVTEAVKKRAGDKHVMVKLSPNVTDIVTCAKAAVDGGADSLSLINTLSGMAVDIYNRKPRIANVIAGLSGPAIKPVALRCVHQVVQAVDVPVVGIGGIASAEDALEFLLVGAQAVQVGTANFLRPDFAFTLVDEVEALLKEVGAGSLDEFRGSLQLPL